MLVYLEIVRYAHFEDKIYNDITHYFGKILFKPSV